LFKDRAMDDREEPLYGGLVGGRVVKVGDTVRRPAGGWTATIQALLGHLQTKDFPSPHPMGIDGVGREVVSFLPGVCSNHPWPPGLLAISGAREVGAMLRAYHAAVAEFRPPEPAIWRHGAQRLGAGHVVIHGDFGPHNLIWTGDRLTGVIDFELARPGRPIEDAVFAGLRVAHLRPDETAGVVGFGGPPNRRERLEAFADGYGVAADVLLADAMAVQAMELDRILRLGGGGMEPWATFLKRGLAAQVQLEMTWLENNLARLA
jgi:hypothetical protein